MSGGSENAPCLDFGEDSDTYESADQQHVTSIDTIECISLDSTMQSIAV